MNEVINFFFTFLADLIVLISRYWILSIFLLLSIINMVISLILNSQSKNN